MREVESEIPVVRAPRDPASEEMMSVVYYELRRLAEYYLRGERTDHTLQPTALVHEAYLRLVQQHGGWQSREHFIGVAATMMRRILVSYATRRNRQKRGGCDIRIPIDELKGYTSDRARDASVLELDEALTHLAGEYPREAQVVELKFFGGCSIAEVAGFLQVSEATVERSWRFARAWLLRELTDGPR